MSNRKKLTPRRNGARRLSMAQEIELTIGPGPRGRSAFTDDAHRRHSWQSHRDRILEEHPNAWARGAYDDERRT